MSLIFPDSNTEIHKSFVKFRLRDMFSLLFLFFALSVAYCKERAITNGYDAPYRKFYALLQIFEYGESDDSWNTCGGSIINKNYILTAAHCLDGKNGKINSAICSLNDTRQKYLPGKYIFFKLMLRWLYPIIVPSPLDNYSLIIENGFFFC